MVTLYLTNQGAEVRKRSRCVLIEHEGKTLMEIPIFKIERISLLGNIGLTTPAIGLLLDEGVDVSFMNQHGDLRGRLVGKLSKNVFQRIGQYKTFLDLPFQVRSSCKLVAAKIKACRRVLQRHRNRMPASEANEALAKLDQYARRAADAGSLSAVRGVEGHSAHVYFTGFAAALAEPFTFSRRSRRPPADPVNAMLSFGYTVLANDIQSALESQGLDPFAGFFHQLKYGRATLAFDVEELFRHPVVDGLVLEIASRKWFGLECFEDRDGGCYLNAEGRKKFLAQYERRMGGAGDERNNFRKAVFQQAEHLARVASGKEEFEPWVYH